MLFQRKIDRAFKKLHEESDHPENRSTCKRKKNGKDENGRSRGAKSPGISSIRRI